jgi:hypothetical protein
MSAVAGLFLLANGAAASETFKSIMETMGRNYKALSVQMRAGQLGRPAEEACTNMIAGFNEFSAMFPPMIEQMPESAAREDAVQKYHVLTDQLGPALAALKASVVANDMTGATRNLREVTQIKGTGHDLFKPAPTN